MIISSVSPYLKILTDYLLENFGCLCTVSTIWVEKVLPRTFALLKIFAENEYCILADASCESSMYNEGYPGNRLFNGQSQQWIDFEQISQ